MNRHEEAEQLRRELESYNYITKKIEENETVLQQLFMIQSNLHGIDYSRVRVQTQVEGKPDSYYNLIERKDELITETSALKKRKKKVDDFLSSLDEEEKEIVTERFIYNHKLGKIGSRHNYSVSGVQWKITSIIKKGV